MRNIRPLAILLTLLVCYQIGHAQIDQRNLKFERDLNSATILDIISDRNGVLWISTSAGLMKYDGYEFMQYIADEHDSTTIGSQFQRSLFEDSDGKIWIGGRGEINIYDPQSKTFRRLDFHHLYENSEQLVTSVIVSDGKGRIYFGISSMYRSRNPASKALMYYEKENGKLKHFDYPDSLDIQNVQKAAIGPDGGIYIRASNGLFLLDSENKLHKISTSWLLNDEDIRSIRADSGGKLWFDTTKDILYCFDRNTEDIQKWDYSKLVQPYIYGIPKNIEFDNSGNLWITSLNNAVRFNTSNYTFDVLDLDVRNAEFEFNPTCFEPDQYGNIWIGTVQGGLFKFKDNNAFNSFLLHESVTTLKSNSSNKVSLSARFIFRDTDDIIWMVGQHADGVMTYNPESDSFTVRSYSDLFPGMKGIRIMGELFPQQILFRSNKGLGLLNTKDQSIEQYEITGFKEDTNLRSIYRDSRSNIWLCSDRGLLQFREGVIFNYFELSALPGCTERSNIVNNVYESNEYGLWVWTENGLFLYNYQDESITRQAFDKEVGDVLPSHDINALYEDENGYIWLATWLGGLCKYDPKTATIKVYSVKHGLVNSSVQGILPDEEHNTLWLSFASRGNISKFEMSEEIFHNFSLEDGIYGHGFSELAQIKASNGNYFFGGTRGLTYFKPRDISMFSQAPDMSITDFKVENASKIIANSVEGKYVQLSYKEHSFSIDYLGIQYDAPVKNTFAYRLINYDNNWQYVKNARIAHYYNLPPGKYTFEVMGANNNGIWSTDNPSLNIKILPPWWRTWWAYSIYGILFIAGFYTVHRIQKERTIRKERERSREKELAQAKEIEKAYKELEVAHADLKSTQSQLIQSEKMASLGELTAGIAHEIQNPLNFVNNFSEVNRELIEELEVERSKVKGQRDEKLEDELIKDLKENEEKIKHHGQRAEGIVKGMLQHSRTSQGEKEPTDLNALADEYLRLAFHGLRAKDKNFNADFKTEFDDSLPKLNVVPQDIGRVLLNLINNAFYVVNKKAMENLAGYKPEVTVTTKLIPPASPAGRLQEGVQGEEKIEISVTDNGPGIPEDIKDKIFQPFFTTKPTGSGTGLGLSLSYDIVKAHGGELKVEIPPALPRRSPAGEAGEEGEGSVFIIQLPVNT